MNRIDVILEKIDTIREDVGDLKTSKRESEAFQNKVLGGLQIVKILGGLGLFILTLGEGAISAWVWSVNNSEKDSDQRLIKIELRVDRDEIDANRQQTIIEGRFNGVEKHLSAEDEAIEALKIGKLDKRPEK